MRRMKIHAEDALLSVSQVNIKRNKKTILQDIDFAVHAGEIVTLIGPNGAGKSTLIKVALEFIAADSGEVNRRHGISIGYVPQQIEFDPTLPLTLRRFLNLERRHSPTDIEQTLLKVGLIKTGGDHDNDLRDSTMHSLSGGETRRALLARALLREPDLLILDEPGAGMDVGGQAELYRLLQTIRAERRCGILLVSHDLHMVMAATDKVLCLNRHLCCSGKPHDVRQHPEFLALFGARAAAELAASELAIYQHHHDHEHGLHGEIKPADKPNDKQ